MLRQKDVWICTGGYTGVWDLLLGKRNIQTLIILFLVGPRQKADTARNTVSKWIGNHTKVMWKLHTFPSTLQCLIHINNITYRDRILASNGTYRPFFPSLVCRVSRIMLYLWITLIDKWCICMVDNQVHQKLRMVVIILELVICHIIIIPHLFTYHLLLQWWWAALFDLWWHSGGA